MGPANNLSYLLNHLAAVIGKQSDQVLQEQFGISLSDEELAQALATVEAKGSKGAPHPFFA